MPEATTTTTNETQASDQVGAEGVRPAPEDARILVVTPEITYLPEGMGNLAQRMRGAKAGGLADVSASLVSVLYGKGADVHVALPNYRRMFGTNDGYIFEKEMQKVREELPRQRIHLAEDRIFYHRDEVYCGYENARIALAFQREVINHVIPAVRPHLIHCNDWMTGLIPAVARRWGIRSLFTVHNIHTEKLTLEEIEDRGIDAADFWEHLYFERPPQNYEESRPSNPVDFLASGIFASDHVNTVSPTFLEEVVAGSHHFVPAAIRQELANKKHAGCASGILNAPDNSFQPSEDPYLARRFGADDHLSGKQANKLEFQRRTGLEERPDAPLFFWPSRLDPVQKGCQLVTDILYETVSRYWDDGIQVAVVANGAYQEHFRQIASAHRLGTRITVQDFAEPLSHLGYAASDFMLMPSRFEPCGLPQMIGPKYGSLPIVHDTGGLHDTVEHLDHEAGTGNGFVFAYYDAQGLRWGIEQAIHFFRQPADVKTAQIRRIMEESSLRFHHDTTSDEYIRLYEDILERKITSQ